MNAFPHQHWLAKHAFYAATYVILFLSLGSFVAGCKPPPPPPPPPAPPPPPPPPPPLTNAEVSARLRPFFYVFYDRAFNAGSIDSYARWGVEYASRYASPESRASTTSSGLIKAIDDARANTPTLLQVVQQECVSAGIDPTLVIDWGRNASRDLDGQEARELLLNIYALQAYLDADTGNLHRAHVLLRDVMSIMNGERAEAMNDGMESLRRFFLEVPDDARLEEFARRLESYISLQEEKLLLHGEHAAILNAADLTDAAEFTRAKLVTQFDLITMPLINQAILRGESYGFRPPAQLQATRRRLAAHAAALKESQPVKKGDGLCELAMEIPIDEAYRDRFRAFADSLAGGDEKAKPQQTSVEKQINGLWELKRRISDWLKEKALCLEHCPTFLVNPNFVSYGFLESGCPTVFSREDNAFSVANVIRIVDDKARREAVVSWCKGNRLPLEINDGTGHFLLAWFWLEDNRPDYARTALIDGAEHLLETVRSVDIEAMRAQPGANDAAMVRVLEAELNAYRMLMAASMIKTCPPGAVNDSRDSYLPQLEVLLLGWKQSWLKCGLPQDPADEAIDRFSVAAQANAIGLFGTNEMGNSSGVTDRYFFYDYRFDHGSVPNVVVLKASEARMFENSALPELNQNGKFLAFLRGFKKPTEFTQGFSARWRKPPDDQKPKEPQ